MAGGLGLALSGGGAKGAYQVGVLDELIRAKGVDFETVVGTSTGAIQAASVAQDDIGQLVNFWTSLKGSDDIYRSRGGPIWAVITGKNSIYSTGPLRELLNQAYDDAKIRATGKNLRIAVVNITTGDLTIVGENANNIADWVCASSAQPPFFPPFETRDAQGMSAQWVDGGVRDITPYDAALKLRPRAVLVVRAEAPLPKTHKDYDSVIDIGLRSVELLTREVANNDLDNVELINRLLRAEIEQRRVLGTLNLTTDEIEQAMAPIKAEIDRFALIPTKVLQPKTDLYDTLEFVPELIAENIERGRKDVRDQWSELAAFLGVPE